MKNLNFSFNWNNKLHCSSFSTIRIFNPEKYVLLDVYEILLKSKSGKSSEKLGIARLQVITPFLLDNVSPGMCFIDTNLSVIDFISLVQTTYKNKNIDFRKQKMAFMIFQYLTDLEIEDLKSQP